MERQAGSWPRHLVPPGRVSGWLKGLRCRTQALLPVLGPFAALWFCRPVTAWPGVPVRSRRARLQNGCLVRTVACGLEQERPSRGPAGLPAVRLKSGASWSPWCHLWSHRPWWILSANIRTLSPKRQQPPIGEEKGADPKAAVRTSSWERGRRKSSAPATGNSACPLCTPPPLSCGCKPARTRHAASLGGAWGRRDVVQAPRDGPPTSRAHRPCSSSLSADNLQA